MALHTLEQLSKAEFNRFRLFIYDISGITLSDEKLPLLSNRLRRRMRQLDLDSYTAYFELVSKQGVDGEEFPFFLDAVTTNETYFFRNDKLWPAIRELVIPMLVENKAGKSLAELSFWCAACSCGAEPYTLAMVLDQMKPKLKGLKPKIVATDLSRAELQKARDGVFIERFFQRTDEATRKKYFKQVDDGWEIKPAVKSMVEFKFHNLKDAMKSQRFDCVILRNVLMYFDDEMKEIAYRNTAGALAPGGVLIVGDVDQLHSDKERQKRLGVEYIQTGMYRKL